jgi:hypothetical protein
MTHATTRREFAATAVASLTGLGLGAKAAVAGTKTLRFIAQ